jgi:hypothetical protein
MKEIGKEDVYEVSGVIPLRYVDDLLDVCQLNSYERLQLQVESLMCEGTTGFLANFMLFFYLEHDSLCCFKKSRSVFSGNSWIRSDF